MSDKRKRGQNFTLEEKDRLIKLLLQHKDTLLNKRTDGATNESKCMAWTSITDSFNSSGSINRTKESLMKIWEKLKSESKLYYNKSKKDMTQTGGGPSVVKVDPILEQVCVILGRGCTGIIGVPDSDYLDDTEEIVESVKPTPKVICLSNNDHIPETVVSTPSITTVHFEVDNHEDCNRKTPLWSRRRPQLSQANERSEVVSGLCDSFKNVNKKKETLEDLKCQLLQEELEYKRKLYQLQLCAAAKEVEIKHEILEQIKGGALGLQNLIGVSHNNNV